MTRKNKKLLFLFLSLALALLLVGTLAFLSNGKNKSTSTYRNAMASFKTENNYSPPITTITKINNKPSVAVTLKSQNCLGKFNLSPADLDKKESIIRKIFPTNASNVSETIHWSSEHFRNYNGDVYIVYHETSESQEGGPINRLKVFKEDKFGLPHQVFVSENDDVNPTAKTLNKIAQKMKGELIFKNKVYSLGVGNSYVTINEDLTNQKILSFNAYVGGRTVECKNSQCQCLN